MTKITEIKSLINELNIIYLERSGDWASTGIFWKLEKNGIHSPGWGGNIDTENRRIHALKDIIIKLKELTND